MSRAWAFAAGALLGLAALPLSGLEIAGLLWAPAFLLMAGGWKSDLRSPLIDCLIFACSRLLVQNIWIFQAIPYYLPGSFFKTTLIYLSANLALSWPFALVCGGWFFLARAFSGRLAFLKNRRRAMFVLSFPLVNYLSFKLGSLSFLPDLPGGNLAENPLFSDNFPLVYSYLGVEGFEFFILGSLIFISFFLFYSWRLGLSFALFPLLGVILLQAAAPSLAGQSRYKDPLTLLLVPWSDGIPDNALREKALEDLLFRSKSANITGVDLIVWGESALPGLAESGRDMERIRRELLRPSQALIFGGNRREFGENDFKNFNSAYILYGDEFRYEIYKKENLVPFVEYLPSWASRVGLRPISEREYYFTPGESRFLRFRNLLVSAGVCYDQYINKWQSQKDSETDLYIFINREYAFQPLGKEILRRSALARALQTEKPVVRLTNDGFSGLAGKGKAKWDRSSGTALVEVTPGGGESFFYRLGSIWAPLILFCHSCLTILIYIKTRRGRFQTEAQKQLLRPRGADIVKRDKTLKFSD